MIKFQFEIKRIDSYNLEEFHYDTGKYHHEAGKIKPQSRKNQATKQEKSSRKVGKIKPQSRKNQTAKQEESNHKTGKNLISRGGPGWQSASCAAAVCW